MIHPPIHFWQRRAIALAGTALVGAALSIMLGLHSVQSVNEPNQNLTAARPVLVLQTGHSWGVNCAVFAADGSWLASGGADNAIKIWQTGAGRELRSLVGHHGYVKSLARSSNGNWLASGANDREIKVWEIASGKQLHSLRGHLGPVEALAFLFSRDGRHMISWP